MRYLRFLEGLHERLQPPTYLEIGVRHGDSLALSRATSIGVDPMPRLKVDLPAHTTIYEQASDEHFAQERPLGAFGGRPAALAFIDGMHLAEFALRDFINVERHADWTTVAVFDDLFPRRAEEANRRRSTRAWTGDVYKVAGVLRRHRPDLTLLRVGTAPTGLLVVCGLDPSNAVLRERYEGIARAMVRPDPQTVPAALLERRGALEPQAVLDSRAWELLREAREAGLSRDQGISGVHEALGPWAAGSRPASRTRAGALARKLRRAAGRVASGR